MILRGVLDEGVVQTFAERVGLQDLGEPENRDATTSRGWKVDDGLELHYGWDARSGRGFLQVLGDNQADAEEIARAIEEHFLPLSYDQLLSMFRNADSPQNRAQATLLVGLGQPPSFDQDFFDCILDALGDFNRDIREAGLFAASHRVTTGMVPIIKVMAAGDPDDDVRDIAEMLLEICQEEGMA
ncbi:hypothetical protein ABH935_006312 [Catenulispora sp. GAS73]|uniref:hypothetical protein n=1 Tax=Catenulispora sp. GAS73 TaxID=3156269 RepID=UPI003515904D